MKPFYTLLFFLISFAFAEAQIVNIPDANFKNILTTENCVDLDNDGAGDADADTNDDGEIQVSEAEAVEHLILESASPSFQIILDITGLETFVNLKTFNADGVRFYELQNNGVDFEYVGVNSLDFTSFSSMEKIRLSDELSSVLTSIDVSGLTNLTTFNAFWIRPEDSFEENQIPVNINFQGCTSLTSLNFANSFVDIDFCQIPSLETVICWELYQSSNVNLDFNCLTNLKTLDISLNNLNSLYLKNNSLLETFSYFSTSGNVLCIDNNQEEFDSMGTLLESFDYITTTCEVPSGGNVVSGDILANLATNNESCETNSLPGPLNIKLVQNNTTVLSVLSNTTETYEIPVGQGDYQVSIDTRFSDGFTVVPGQFDVSFSGDNGEVFIQDVCLEPRVETVNGIEIKFYPYYYPPDPLINRFDAYVVLKNTNPTSFSGELKLNYDDNYSTLIDSGEMPSSETDGEAIWDYISIAGNGYFSMYLRIGYNSSSHPNYPLFAGDNLVFDLFLTDSQNGDVLASEDDAPDFRLIQTIDASDQVLSDNEYSLVEESTIKVYPNPTDGEVHFKHTEMIEEILVYSMSGQLVNHIKSNHDSGLSTLDMSKLEEGIYFATIHTNSEVVKKKIIKN